MRDGVCTASVLLGPIIGPLVCLSAALSNHAAHHATVTKGDGNQEVLVAVCFEHAGLFRSR